MGSAQSRFFSRLTFAAGLVTIAFALWLGTIFPSKAELTRDFKTPILAFEFAQTPDDLDFLSGQDDGPRALRQAMDEGHRWDMIFPFVYAGLLFLTCLHQGLRGFKTGWLGLPVAFLVVISDLWENIVLTSITAALDQGQTIVPLLDGLYWATWAKWGCLALTLVLAAVPFWSGKRWIAALPMTAAALTIALTWILGAPGSVAELMGLCVGLAYVGLTLELGIRLKSGG